MLHRLVWLALGACVLVAPAARAQDAPLSDVLVRLVQADVRLAGPPPGSPFPSHEAHFIPGEDARLAPYVFNQNIVSQLSTFPLGYSSGGLSYSFDPGLGTYSRSSTTFGPSFAERALTIGRGRWSVGASYQHASFSSFEGRDLDGGEIRFYLTHVPVGGAFFEGDLVETTLSLDLKTDTVAIFATYGVTDRLDIGVAVPIVHVSMEATVQARILRLSTLDSGPTAAIHSFPDGTPTSTFSGAGSATGIGDVLVRGKYRVFDGAGGGLAVAAEVRTPSGDADNLLGTGATQAKLLLVGSTVYDRVSPHFNVGFTVSGDSDNPSLTISDEFNYNAGAEVGVAPTLTITGDIVGRQLRGFGRLRETAKTFAWTTQAGVRGTSTFTEFAPENGSLNLLFGTVGVKYNPVQNLLLSANVLIPFTDAGMRSSPVPVVGVEYSF